jgi:hypothetical protein
MKKLVGLATLWTLFALVAMPIASAQQGNGNRPTHGCAQADENDGDPYDSTCDGSPSENGVGEGKATGKPCAGCVGAADNKNPKGQLPNGTDPNQGYECDGNEGVGKGNPAHTSCDAYSGRAPAIEEQTIEGSNAVAYERTLDDPSGIAEEDGPLTGGTLALISLTGLALLLALRSATRRSVARHEAQDL